MLKTWPYIRSILSHSFLPALSLVLGGTAFRFIIAKALTSTIVSSDYVSYADLAGLPKRKIIFGYVMRNSLLPQVVPVFVSQTLYQWESNTRGATIIGAVGAGGIGLKLWEAMRTNSNWNNVFYMVLLILLVVFIFDNISGMVRRRLIGEAAREH